MITVPAFIDTHTDTVNMKNITIMLFIILRISLNSVILYSLQYTHTELCQFCMPNRL